MLLATLYIIAGLQGSSLEMFAYEVDRAKRTIGTYGHHVFRGERIHRRVGVEGSVIETFCAITQTRDGEGRVSERPVYWVVRVRPRNGFLSDYERGSWSLPPPDTESDYEKLCLHSNTMADSELLRSASSTSSGSTYDVTNDTSQGVSFNWLIGNWVASDTCATSRDELFRSDGRYDGSFGEGTWALNGDILILSIEQRNDADLGEMGRRTYFDPARVVHRRVNRTGIDTMIFSETKYLRC